jgi:predicted CoA-substrate-specific enzyme activase
MTAPLTLGVDAGSREVKLVIGGGGEIVFSAIMDTVQFYLSCRNGGGELDLTRIRELSTAPAYGRVVATGYGRDNVTVAGGKTIPEIMAHTAGAVSQTGLRDFTLVDMGGQDTKVIQVKDGAVEDFVMNDKCAAGSGRYLENIAKALGASLEKLGQCWENPAKLASACAIFGESEVVGLVSDGVPVDSILAGANASMVARLKPMIMRYRPKTLALSGGVAMNNAVRILLSREIGVEALALAQSRLNGAIGCVIN